MKLKAWLTETRTRYQDFAERIGVANRSVVHKYAAGRVPRDSTTMAAIVRETGGAVQPNDFYADAAE